MNQPASQPSRGRYNAPVPRNTDRPWIGHGDLIIFTDAAGKHRTGKAVRFQPGFIVCLVRQSAEMVYPRPSYPKVADMALYGVPYASVVSVSRPPPRLIPTATDVPVATDVPTVT